MKLLFIFTATLALSLAESEKRHYEDLEAAESIELQKTHDLDSSATAYNPVPYSSWSPPQYIPPQNNNQQPYTPPFAPAPPSNSQYVPGFPPNPVQSDYPQPLPPTSTPNPVIKNEQYSNNDGSYGYEYQLADGTWVGEQGWVVPGAKQGETDVVKKGWYQYKANDGKIYTVTYWADHTGYHAYGAHLPVASSTPPATQTTTTTTTTRRPVYYDTPQQQQYPPQQPQYPPQPSQYPPQPSPYSSQQPQYISQQPQYPFQQPQYPQSQQPYYPPQMK